MLRGEHHEAGHGGRISIVEGDADTEDGAGVALGAGVAWWRSAGAGVAGLRRDGASAGADLVYGAEVREPASYGRARRWANRMLQARWSWQASVGLASMLR